MSLHNTLMINFCRQTLLLSCLIPLLVAVGVVSLCGEVHLFSSNDCLSTSRHGQGSVERCIHPINDSKLVILQTDSAIHFEISCNCCEGGIPHPCIRAQFEATASREQGWSGIGSDRCFASFFASATISGITVRAHNLAFVRGRDLASCLALPRLQSVRLLV